MSEIDEYTIRATLEDVEYVFQHINLADAQVVRDLFNREGYTMMGALVNAVTDPGIGALLAGTEGVW